MNRALELGRAREATYGNDKQQVVRWALVQVVNLDWVGRKVDGAEVASNLHYRTTKTPVSPRKQFLTENSEPSQSF